jgi:hypothetical protein
MHGMVQCKDNPKGEDCLLHGFLAVLRGLQDPAAGTDLQNNQQTALQEQPLQV